MKIKKSYMIWGGAILYLVICWIVGQFLHGGKAGENALQEQNGQADSEWSVTYEGSKQTDDNPWGMTAGTIEWEGEDYIFLTPNTSAILSNLPTSGEIELTYRIHPWVSEGSDGVGLVITVMDETGTDINSEEFMVGADDILESKVLDMSAYTGGSRIRLSCNNGEHDDDSADWVIAQILLH